MKLLTQDLREAGFTVVNEGHRTLWVPDQDALGGLSRIRPGVCPGNQVKKSNPPGFQPGGFFNKLLSRVLRGGGFELDPAQFFK